MDLPAAARGVEACLRETSLAREILQSKETVDSIVDHHRRSGDEMIRRCLDVVREKPEVVATNVKDMLEVRVRFKDPRLGLPMVVEEDRAVRVVTPDECRTRSLDYEAPLRADAHVEVLRLEPIEPDADDYEAPADRVAALSEPADRAGPGPYPFDPSPRLRRVPLGPARVFHDAVVCMLPVVVGSSYCTTRRRPAEGPRDPLDCGGTVIVRGYDRVIQPQKTQIPGRVVLTESKRGGTEAYDAVVRSPHPTRARNTCTVHVVIQRKPAGQVLVNIPFLRAGVPVLMVFRMLGFELDDVMALVWPEPDAEVLCPPAKALLRRSLVVDPRATGPLEDIYRWIAAGSDFPAPAGRRNVHTQIASEFLPHLGVEFTPQVCFRKALFLALIVRRLCCVLEDPERFPVDLRDAEDFKHLQWMHVTFSVMFRQLYAEYTRQVRQLIFARLGKSRGSFSLDRVYARLDLPSLVQRRFLTSNIQRRLAKGELVVRKSASDTASGIVQLLTQTNWMAVRAHLGRYAKPANPEGRYTELRELQDGILGAVDPCATPEGTPIGLIESLAVGVHVRMETPQPAVEAAVRALELAAPVVDLPADAAALRAAIARGAALVHVSHVIVGITTDPLALVDAARAARRGGALPQDCSVTLEPDGVHVDADDGVLGFPALRVAALDPARVDRVRAEALADGTPLLRALLREGIAEFLSVREAYQARLAPTWQEAVSRLRGGEPVTHVIPHPSLMLGTASACIPFLNNNQGPRTTYWANMAGQALGLAFLGHTAVPGPLARFDGVAYQLHYPQRPLAMTAAEAAMDMPPMGQCLLVAVLGDAHNFEDAVTVKRQFLDRGGLAHTTWLTFTEKCRNPRGEGAATASVEAFCHPLHEDPATGATLNLYEDADYSRIGADGLPDCGAWIRPGDVLIGKVTYVTEVTADGVSRAVRYDASSVYRYDEPAVVQDVVRTSSGGSDVALVRLRVASRPMVGDKLTTRHGQKGTVATVVREEDLPYVAAGPMAGMVPDLLIAPMAFPSRMTAGQMRESLVSRVATALGMLYDASPWISELTADELLEVLREATGDAPTVPMIHGTTGLPLEHPVDVGLVFYQALNHMAQKKVRSRYKGPVSAVTGQPRKGKKRDGGLRVGEMERDVISAQGASDVLRGRMVHASDGQPLRVCAHCGEINGTPWVRLDDLAAELAVDEDGAAGGAAGGGGGASASARRCLLCGHESVLEVPSVRAFDVALREAQIMGIRAQLRITEG